MHCRDCNEWSFFASFIEPFLGPELDQPVFYVSATIEMSLEPMLPVYNLTVSSDSNPRYRVAALHGVYRLNFSFQKAQFPYTGRRVGTITCK